jgi:hypothetical protein
LSAEARPARPSITKSENKQARPIAYRLSKANSDRVRPALGV